MRYLSLFSGIGGFELGIKKAYEDIKTQQGYSERQTELDNSYSDLSNNRDINKSPICIGYSEIDKYAIQIYEKHFNHKNWGDITAIIASELPDFDLLVGGFPCQAFSIAGKRGGFDDTRGTLFFDIARILKEKRPRNFILENVKGLLSHDSGRTFKTIISTLVELGYCVEWQVLNTKNFGVPQNRERVFIVGHFGGIPERKVFPIGSETEMVVKSKQPTEVQIASTIAGAGGHIANGEYKGMNLIQINNPKHSNDRVYGEDGVAPTLNTMQGGLRQPFVAPVLTPDRPNKRQNGRRFKEDGEPSFTLTGQDKHGVYDGMKIRRLTPKECERLMGFPDGWTEGVSDTQRYKCLGNALVSNVVVEIVKKLLCG